LTERSAVLLHTDDRRVTAAVSSFLDAVGLAARVVGPEVPALEAGTVVLADARGEGARTVRRYLEAGARVVAVVDDLAGARGVIDEGAHDFVLADDGERAGLRVWMAINAGSTASAGAGLGKLVRHDLRSPLAVLLGQCEILSIGLGGPLTDMQRRSVEAMERKTRELQEMLERLTEELSDRFGWETRR